MTIGEMIEKYCRDNEITNQHFAELCKVSKGYISQLINGRNPKTGRPITPTIETYIKIAEAMNITIEDLFRQIDDAPIVIKRRTDEKLKSIGEQLTAPSRSREWIALSEGFEKMEQQKYDEFMAIFNMLKATKPEFFNERNNDDDTES